MSLIKTGQGITDIRGGFGGVYFHRDKSGLHSCSKPRTVHRRSAGQNKQRNCFTKARTYSKDERTVSYLIYRCLNGLPFYFDAFVTGNPVPDCTGKYVDAGEYENARYYERTDSAYFIWYHEGTAYWYISPTLGLKAMTFWTRQYTISGVYTPGPSYSGNPIVKLQVQPPPADYQIPRL